MKNFNWGKGITIFIILFLVVTIGQVILIHKLVDYDLVEEEYYDAEINFQKQINRVKRTNELSEKLSVKVLADSIEFNFPKMFNSKSINGIINFYKPSDDLLDKNAMIIVDNNNKMYFDKSRLSPGLWRLKIDWNVDSVEYYNEKIIMVN
jgi:hypothetical protein